MPIHGGGRKINIKRSFASALGGMEILDGTA